MPITELGREKADELKILPERFDLLEKKLIQFVEEGYEQCIETKIMRYGQSIFEGAYGLSKPGDCTSNQKQDMIFPVCSITKPIIAALIMQLHEDGEIDITHNVEEYVPEFQCFNENHAKTENEKIKIWHLLTHTSGLQDDEIDRDVRGYLKSELKIDVPKEGAFMKELIHASKILKLPVKRDRAPIDTWNYLALRITPVRSSREVMMYCNYNYELCKEIIIRAYGKSINEVANEKLFNPLRMKDSHFILPKEKWDRMARRGKEYEGYPILNSPEWFNNDGGSGGLKTTVNDIIRFCEMIRQEGEFNGVRVLSPFTVRTMRQNFNGDMPGNLDARTLGFNYRGTKLDDFSIMRSASTIDHIAFGGARIFIDVENGLSCAFFGVLANDKKNPFDKFSNIVYSALTD
ncbi:serine hydrolase domain-containing protein [Clostridium sp. E02]|uniref:serine hydrolase domain-containing protein n=1 Tax=Clostridium sp. E02 TaxID=2487134 RepID=UPI000F543BC8|nr:serine hydrolase domain-containing protein [Clostridium sp. E02]